MKQFNLFIGRHLAKGMMYMFLTVLCLLGNRLHAQTTDEVMAPGSFIINMGIVPQTVKNALKPYGMIYDLTKNYQVPIKWVISPTKARGGIDFTLPNGTSFSGGTFIIPAEYITSTVQLRIDYWTSSAVGVVGVKTTQAVTVPVYATIATSIRWTLDQKNGKYAEDYLNSAGIPSTAYDWKDPADLSCCDDVFAMPHADPKWSTHGNLYDWNQTCKGAIWLGCHAGSALMDMFDNVAPVNYNLQTNFLCGKTGPASGNGPYSENALVLWGNHDNGHRPYSYDYPNEPVMQFMGKIDDAVQNGSEQVYITKSPGWLSTTHVGVYDPIHPERPSPPNSLEHRAAILAYGPGFGDLNRGWVMLEASHQFTGDDPDQVAAQRAFLNFSLLSAIQHTVIPTLSSSIPDTIPAGVGTSLSYSLPAGVDPANYNTLWTSSCSGGTFAPVAANTNPVTYTPPAGASSCVITVKITDTQSCGRTFYASKRVYVRCALSVTKTVNSTSCNGGANGSIAMTISGGSGPYSWNWSRVSPAGTGSGTGTSISGLSAGSYNVTVTSAAGCSGTFTSLVTQPNAIAATATPTNYQCFGQTGSISLNVTGGTTPYTYNWGGGITTQNRSGLSAGTYTVTVTDANNCTKTASATVGGPVMAVTLSATQINAPCNGGTGSIDLTVSGGTSPYTYDWSNDGPETPDNDLQDLSGLNHGTYTVTVTDANGCTASLSRTITQPATLTLSVIKTNPTCPAASNPPVNMDGAINLSVSGGTSPYSYDWSNLAGTSNPQDQTGLSAGTYSVVVTDANGCTATISVTLTAVNVPPNPPTGVTH